MFCKSVSFLRVGPDEVLIFQFTFSFPIATAAAQDSIPCPELQQTIHAKSILFSLVYHIVKRQHIATT